MNTVRTERPGPAFGGAEPIRELVVPIAGTQRYDRAAAVASALAVRWQLPVRLVHVVTEGSDEVDTDRLERARSELDHRHPEVTVVATLLEGDDPVAAVSDAVDESALLVIATQHAAQWEASDSVGEALALKAETPVLLCGPKVDSEHIFGSVVVGLDGSPTAEAGLDAAAALATSLGTRLWLVRAVDAGTVEHIRQLRASGATASESAYLVEVAERLQARGLDVGWEIVHDDDPVAAILGFARNQGAGPLVAGTHGDTGISRRMFGSTAMGLVEESPFPVLVVNAGGRDEPQLTT